MRSWRRSLGTKCQAQYHASTKLVHLAKFKVLLLMKIVLSSMLIFGFLKLTP